MLNERLSEKWQDSECQRHGAGEKEMGEDELQRESEEESWSQDP